MVIIIGINVNVMSTMLITAKLPPVSFFFSVKMAGQLV